MQINEKTKRLEKAKKFCEEKGIVKRLDNVLSTELIKSIQNHWYRLADGVILHHHQILPIDLQAQSQKVYEEVQCFKEFQKMVIKEYTEERYNTMLQLQELVEEELIDQKYATVVYESFLVNYGSLRTCCIDVSEIAEKLAYEMVFSYMSAVYSDYPEERIRAITNSAYDYSIYCMSELDNSLFEIIPIK